MTISRTEETAWTAGAFAVQLLGQVARAVLLARLLSPADLGRFLVLRSIVAVVALVAQSGLGPVGLRRVAAAGADTGVRRGIVRAVVGVTTAGATQAGALIAIGTVLWGFSALEAASLAVMVMTSTLSAVLASLGRGLSLTPVVVAIERGLATLLDVVVAGVMIGVAGHADLRSVLWPLALVSVVPVALLSGRLRGATRGAVPAVGVRPAELVREAWPITVNGLLWRGLADADLWLVGWFAGAPAAAIYGVASRVAVVLQAPAAIAAYALAPGVATLHASGETRGLERLLRRAARWMTAGSALGFAAVAVLGEQGLAVVFGPDYRAAWPIFLVLGASQVINSVAGLGGTALLMIGRQRTLMIISFVCGTVTVAGAALLLPVAGSIGAAAAAASGLTLQNALMVRAVRRYAGVRVHV